MSNDQGGQDNPPARREYQILASMLLLVATLSLLSSAVTPPFEPPDELQHYQYVRHLIDEKSLPVQTLNGTMTQSHQPPLYYMVAALLVAGLPDPQTPPTRNPYWSYTAVVGRDNKLQFLNPASQPFPYRGTALVIHILRLSSVILALGTVTATWLIARSLWPGQPAKIATLMAICLLNPMFLYISGSVNNDNMVILWGALTLWLTVEAVKDGFSRQKAILLGLVWGCALLSKLTGLVLAVSWATALAWTAWQRRDIRLFLARLALIVAIALALSGWWFVRNLIIYGELLALERVLVVWGARESFDVIHIWHDLLNSWTNFWGRFGYGQIPLPNLIYQIFWLMAGLALAGGLKRVAAGLRPRPLRQPRGAIWFILFVTVLAFWAALFYYIVRNPTGANGRYTFPALPAFAALITVGLLSWSAQPKWQWRIQAVTIITMIVIAVFAIGLLLPWTYARPPLLTEAQALEQVYTAQTVNWAEGITLLGAAVAPQQLSVGEKVKLTACWRSDAKIEANYTFYVHLLDNQFRSLGQRDTYTGLGTFPTSLWQPGDTFCETYPVQATQPLTLPVVANVAIGFYDSRPAQQLTARTAEGVPLEWVMVGQVKLLPAAPPPAATMPNETDARFTQGLTLAGYSWSMNEIAAGETVSIQIAWRAAGPLDQSYTLFAHLLDQNGNLIAQDDGLPRDGAYPTTFWGPDETILDERSFELPESAARGPTTLRVGFYLLADGRRLPREAGAPLGDAAEIAGPTIVNR